MLPTKARDPKTVAYIVIHCSATPPDADIGVNEIDRWHRAKGFLKVGYHYVIRRDGTVEEGRSRYEPGAHVEGYNHNSLGVCLVGGVKQVKDADGKDDIDGPMWDLKPENNYTDAQWASLRTLVKALQEFAPSAVVMGHREFPGVKKSCPCFDVSDWRRCLDDA